MRSTKREKRKRNDISNSLSNSFNLSERFIQTSVLKIRLEKSIRKINFKKGRKKKKEKEGKDTIKIRGFFKKKKKMKIYQSQGYPLFFILKSKFNILTIFLQ